MNVPSAQRNARHHLQRAELLEAAAEAYHRTFGSRPKIVASAPGRVNLIGEHTDYNDGLVLPAAINRHVGVAAGIRADNQLAIHSVDFASTVQTSLTQLHPTREDAWANYVKGVTYLLWKSGLPLRGANLSVAGTIPQEAGLSSSAALEVAVCYALTALCEGTLDDLAKIRLCQQAENEFVGVSCGIMDQFASALGKHQHALFLDCRSLAFDLIPVPADAELIVCFTGVRRSLSSSAYNLRREECRTAVGHLTPAVPFLRSLRDLTPELLAEHGDLLPPVTLRRCRHVVSENARVLRSIVALRGNDLSEFGKLMYQSHLSLKNDFEVSCGELDAAVDICAEAEGVYGARMTGAGFGGSTICLVQRDASPALVRRLEAEYPAKTGCSPLVMRCRIDDGVTVSELQGGGDR